MSNVLSIVILLFIPLSLNAQDTRGELEGKEFQAGLLRGNFARCEFTGRVRITDVSVHEELPPLYTVLKYQAETLEVYKGAKLRHITYFHMTETPSVPSIINRSQGTTAIVSLFYNSRTRTYEMGDNGYGLPDTAYLLAIARSLANERKGAAGSSKKSSANKAMEPTR
jgi:hypothetical protein